MIKFFRKIRQKLLSEKKFSKYLIYAVGEIILVMIGILLALQVSNWNKNQQNLNSEKKLLANLQKEFVFNKVQFEKTKLNHQNQLKTLDKILNTFPLNEKKHLADSVKYYEESIKLNTFNPSSSAIDAILSSNSIEIIQNDTLQKYLTTWRNVMIDYLEEEDAYYKFLNNYYWPYTIETFDMINKSSEKYVEPYFTKKYQNFVTFRRGYVRNIVNAIREEPIEYHINEIIRLTKPKE